MDDRLIDSMRKRVPWRVASNILSRLDLPRGHGWEKTADRLKNIEDDDDRALALIGEYEEHVLYGEKNVRLYGPEKNAKLRKALAEDEPGSSKLVSAYPYVLDDAELAAVKPSKPRLAKLQEYENGLAAIFTSIRVVEVQQEIDASQLPSSFPEEARA